ncbi:MAG: rhodanese-like domain-containing protein [Gammaproteobacteria bacterium]
MSDLVPSPARRPAFSVLADIILMLWNSLALLWNKPQQGISAAELPADALLLDVRSQHEWRRGHARGAQWLPWLQVRQRAAGQLTDLDQPIVTYCTLGPRAQVAARRLRELGYRRVVALRGGYRDLLRQDPPAAP